MSVIEILFSNEHFVAVQKKHGELTVPSRFANDDSRPCLGTRLQQQLKRQIYPVHRLDFEVAGLVLFALNPEAHRHSNKWFEQSLVKKIYRALTPGEFISPYDFIWENKMVRGKKRSFIADYGQCAKTVAKKCREIMMNDRSTQKILLWELHPITGRSHQLRLHLSLAGYPILGDSLYGSQMSYAPNAIALQAVALDFSNVLERDHFGLPLSINMPVATILGSGLE